MEKLEAVERRYQELDHLLCTPEVLGDRTQLQKLNKERSDLEALVAAWHKLLGIEKVSLLGNSFGGKIAEGALPEQSGVCRMLRTGVRKASTQQ